MLFQLSVWWFCLYQYHHKHDVMAMILWIVLSVLIFQDHCYMFQVLHQLQHCCNIHDCISKTGKFGHVRKLHGPLYSLFIFMDEPLMWLTQRDEGTGLRTLICVQLYCTEPNDVAIMFFPVALPPNLNATMQLWLWFLWWAQSASRSQSMGQLQVESPLAIHHQETWNSHLDS